MNDLDALLALLTPEGRALLDEVRDTDPASELAVATRLRRTHPPALVSAALGQARLRQRAVAKFGAEDAGRMFFTPYGVEQSTRASVAAYRAECLRAAGARSVADLCCGIGGDAIAFARAGIRVLAVDRDPATCAAARANADALGLADLIEVREADVTEVDTAGYDAVFVDPARRSSRRGRIFDPEAYSPPPVLGRLRRARGAAGAAEDRARHSARGDPGAGDRRVGLGRRGRQGGRAVVRSGRDAGGPAGDAAARRGRDLRDARDHAPRTPRSGRSEGTCTSRTEPSSAPTWWPRSPRTWTAD